MTEPTHKTTRVCNDLFCSVCGKSWSVRDIDQPPCLSKKERQIKRLKQLRDELNC